MTWIFSNKTFHPSQGTLSKCNFTEKMWKCTSHNSVPFLQTCPLKVTYFGFCQVKQAKIFFKKLWKLKSSTFMRLKTFILEFHLTQKAVESRVGHARNFTRQLLFHPRVDWPQAWYTWVFEGLAILIFWPALKLPDLAEKIVYLREH